MTTELRLDGHRVLVTGSARGLGESFVRALVDAGAQNHARTEHRLNAYKTWDGARARTTAESRFCANIVEVHKVFAGAVADAETARAEADAAAAADAVAAAAAAAAAQQ